MEVFKSSKGDLAGADAMGSAAMDMSEMLSGMKDAEKVESKATSTKWASGRMFAWDGQRWVDEGFESSMKTLEITWGSEAFFDLVELRPDLEDALSLGTEIVVVVDGNRAVVVGTDVDGHPKKSKIEKFVD